MNTPKPCDTCKFLYWDCMHEDDPSYSAECMGYLELGKIDCPRYKNWQEKK